MTHLISHDTRLVQLLQATPGDADWHQNSTAQVQTLTHAQAPLKPVGCQHWRLCSPRRGYAHPGGDTLSPCIGWHAQSHRECTSHGLKTHTFKKDWIGPLYWFKNNLNPAADPTYSSKLPKEKSCNCSLFLWSFAPASNPGRPNTAYGLNGEPQYVPQHDSFIHLSGKSFNSLPLSCRSMDPYTSIAAMVTGRGGGALENGERTK